MTIQDLDLRVLLPESGSVGRVFPPAKELTIQEKRTFRDERGVDAIVGLAESQHKLEKPFERVKIRAMGIPVVLVERLKRWAGAVDCYQPCSWCTDGATALVHITQAF